MERRGLKAKDGWEWVLMSFVMVSLFCSGGVMDTNIMYLHVHTHSLTHSLTRDGRGSAPKKGSIDI